MRLIVQSRLQSASLYRNESGAVAVLFALALIPLMLLAGAGLDMSRTYNQKQELQNAVDAAALAGASVYTSSDTQASAVTTATTYMKNFQTSSGLTSLTYTATPGTKKSGSSVTLYSMTVTATSPISNTIMTMVSTSNTTTASATAQNPVYMISISATQFNSSAADENSISYYIVSQDKSTPTNTTLLYSNASGASSAAGKSVSLTASQSIGFMLTNTTSGLNPNAYRGNQYGGSVGSVHVFYSHMFPPSKIAYPSVSQNCSVIVTTTNTAPSGNSCYNSLFPNSAVNCVQASGKTMYFWWNDMGGTTDDKDYNDLYYQVTCSLVDSSVGQGLALIK